VKVTFLLLATILAMAACKRHEDSVLSSTAVARKKLTGVWVSQVAIPSGGSMESTLTVASDGSYLCALSVHTLSNGVRKVELQGSFRVEEGYLIDTTTKNSQTNAPVPTTERARIIRIDDAEIILEYEQHPWVNYATNQIVYTKQRK
jgi:hypothetical protein